MFKKIRTKKVYMKIVEQILRLIKEERLVPGDKLPTENILIQKFGTSRSSVREALSALEVLEIIGKKGGKENFIRYDISPSLLNKKIKKLNTEESPFELLETRLVIEPESASLAAERRTKKDLEVIEKTIKFMKISQNNLHSHIIMCSKFHLEVAKASHNSIILSIMGHLCDGMQATLWENLEKRILKRKIDFTQHYQEHIDILNAIKDKNKNLSREIMTSHLNNLRKGLFNEDYL